MSRIGRMPVTIPAGVEVSIAEPNVVTVKGPKGTLTQTMRPEMIIKVEGNVIHVGRPSEDKLHKSLHGLTRSLIHDRENGILLTADTLPTLGKVLRELSEDPDLRQQLGSAAAEYARENFCTWQERMDREFQAVCALLKK